METYPDELTRTDDEEWYWEDDLYLIAPYGGAANSEDHWEW